MIKLLLIDNSKEISPEFILKLGNLENSNIIISMMVSEINKYLEQKLKSNNNTDNGNSTKPDYMKLYRNIFNFIFDLFKLTTKKNKNISQGDNSDKLNNTKELDNYKKLMNILNFICELLNFEQKKLRKNIHRIYCLVNFLIFFYQMVSKEENLLMYSDFDFILNLNKVFELCKEYCLINCIDIFDFKISNIEYHKTIIEIIYEIYMQIILADENKIEIYNKLLDKYNLPFFDRQFIDNKKYSIFFVTDILNYYSNKNKIKGLDSELIYKCDILSFFNNQLFTNLNKFNGNFSTYFLLIISDSLEQISNKKDFKNVPLEKVSEFLQELYNLLLEEHFGFKSDKKYFFKTNSSNYYNEIINYIKDNCNKKKTKINDIKVFIKSIYEKWSKDKIKISNNTKDFSVSDKINNEQKNILNENFFLVDEIKIDNEIKFFYDLDKYYVTNIKKEIMNCIFSLYYLDELFYCKNFCIIKKYYSNKYLNNSEKTYSKKINFPSIIKNYSNNLEPPLFLKKFNNFLNDPFFPITHSYINAKIKKNLNIEKSIKLKKKEFHYYENDENIECEILKNEKGSYGKLYYSDTKDYLLFIEEKNNFKDEEGYNHLFLISNLEDKDIKINKKPKIILTKYYDKKVLILLDDIEEIIEIRIFLLWKGFEIYLKNGKSYIFNFLTTNEYNNFMKNFILKSKIKHLVRKRDFLSDKNIITNNWVENLLSNYDYLLILNRYSSRSFIDPTQYYVFPWLLRDYSTLQSFLKNEKYYTKIKNEYLKHQEELKKNIYYRQKKKNKNKEMNTTKKILNLDELDKKRELLENDKIDYKGFQDFVKNENYKINKMIRDFRYPPSFQTDDNIQNGIIKYEEDRQCGDKFPCHTGCHYSNNGFIYYYLMREQPYCNYLVKMQEFNLENPNRCFLNIISLQKSNISGNDNRELIPEFFSKIEFFLNLNCDLYGKMTINNQLVDDLEIREIINNKEKSYLSLYTSFIIQHKKLLNSKLIGFHLKKWIDNIFGINQLPPENNRKDTCNIFVKPSYEQTTNLEEKLEKKKKKQGLTKIIIKTSIKQKMEHITNFGVVPSLLFHESHPQLKWELLEEDNKEKQKNENEEDNEEEEEEFNTDLELLIKESISPKKILSPIKGNPIVFKINPTINKIFVFIKEDNIIILDCQLFNEISYNFFYYLNYNIIEKTNILYLRENLEYQIRYSFCSFDKEINYSNNDFGNYHTYYYNKINYLVNKDKIMKEFNNINFDEIIVITCRHIDYSFKIHYLNKTSTDKKIKKKNSIKNKIYSYICEDFVTSCCCISSNAFIIGLNNGKLIYYIIKQNPTFIKVKKTIEQQDNIIIKNKMYIQAHKGKINSIDIDKRLGIVITTGDDNYIF